MTAAPSSAAQRCAIEVPFCRWALPNRGGDAVCASRWLFTEMSPWGKMRGVDHRVPSACGQCAASTTPASAFPPPDGRTDGYAAARWAEDDHGRHQAARRSPLRRTRWWLACRRRRSPNARTSERGVSNLERGISRAPHPHTLGLPAEALGLGATERLELLAAARPALALAPDVQSGMDDAVCSPETVGLLPRELDGFVGRVRDLAEVRRLLGEAPLVTVAGPGGAGKTRLALRLAHQLAQPPENGFSDGVRLGGARPGH